MSKGAREGTANEVEEKPKRLWCPESQVKQMFFILLFGIHKIYKLEVYSFFQWTIMSSYFCQHCARINVDTVRLDLQSPVSEERYE